MAKFLSIIAAGVVAFTGCSADDTVSMVQQSVATEQLPPGGVDKRTKAQEWAKAKEEAGEAFRAERAKQFEAYRIREQMIEERKQQKAAEAAKMEEMKAQQRAQEAAEKKAKQDEISTLRLQLQEQHAATVKAKRNDQKAFRTEVKESRSLKRREGESEQAETRSKAKQQIKEEWSAMKPKKTYNKKWQAPPAAGEKANATYVMAVKKSLMHLNFVDGEGKKEKLTLPKMAQMSLVMKTAAKHLGLDWHSADFAHDGKSLAAEDSLSSTGLQDGDTVIVTPRA